MAGMVVGSRVAHHGSSFNMNAANWQSICKLTHPVCGTHICCETMAAIKGTFNLQVTHFGRINQTTCNGTRHVFEMQDAFYAAHT